MNKETSNINLNIYDYTIDDLLKILNLQYNPSISEINKATTTAISKYSDSDENDPNVILFLQNANKLLIKEFSNNDDEDNDNDVNANDISEKFTNRIKPPDIIQNNKHFLIKQKQMNTANNYELPTIQDTLNPTLNNINSTIINLDSQFRTNILPFEPLNPDSATSSTNYTLDLTEPLTNVLSLKLYSVQIPNTWYRFSESQGNICFFLDFIDNDFIDNTNPPTNTSLNFKFILPQGNYSENDMLSQLNKSTNWFNIITNNIPISAPLEWTYNSNTNKFSFKSNYVLGYTYNLIFYLYDINDVYSCSYGCTSVSNLNHNLGWNIGFRSPLIDGVSYAQYLENNINDDLINNTTFELPAVVDINGPKYFAIILDDFNQNRQNKGLVNIGIPDTKLNIPSYYEPNIIECNLIKHGLQFPRTTTKAQIYTLNEILKNRTTSKIRNYGVNSSDVFAILPIEAKNTQALPYTSFVSNLILNERKYFGPVNISKLKLRLVDDKGNTINLNGGDWCISLITTELYQY